MSEKLSKKEYVLPNGEFDLYSYCVDAESYTECHNICSIICKKCGGCPRDRENDISYSRGKFHGDCINFCEHACPKCGACLRYGYYDNHSCDGNYRERRQKYISSQKENSVCKEMGCND